MSNRKGRADTALRDAFVSLCVNNHILGIYTPNLSFIKPFISVPLISQPNSYFFPSGRLNEERDIAEQLLDLLTAVSPKPSFEEQPGPLCDKTRGFATPFWRSWRRVKDLERLCYKVNLDKNSVGCYLKSSFLLLLTHICNRKMPLPSAKPRRITHWE